MVGQVNMTNPLGYVERRNLVLIFSALTVLSAIGSAIVLW